MNQAETRQIRIMPRTDCTITEVETERVVTVTVGLGCARNHDAGSGQQLYFPGCPSIPACDVFDTRCNRLHLSFCRMQKDDDKKPAAATPAAAATTAAVDASTQFPISDRLAKFTAPTVWHEFTPLAQRTKAVNLGQGFPGWSPPEFVTKHAQDAIKEV